MLPSKLLRCFRFWRELCFSDCIWESLFRKRWPLLTSFDFPAFSSSSSSTSTNSPNFKKWRKLYFKRHMELGVRARSVEKFVEACSRSESLEVREYLNAVETLIGTRFGFEDVQRYLFKPKMNVLLNLVGVHYCLTCLGIRGDNLIKALRACEISDRNVCVKWWKVGRWFYGYRMRDESHSRWVSLADLATEDDEHILGCFAEELFMRFYVFRSLLLVIHQHLGTARLPRDRSREIYYK